MIRLFATTVLAVAAVSSAQAQSITKTCGWITLRDFTKASAATQHCEMNARFNGFGPENPKRSQWIGDCMAIINAAVASCAESDSNCQKDRITAQKDTICALGDKYR